MSIKLWSAHDDLPEEHLLGQFIPLHYHFSMLQNASRMNAFREAIDLVVPVGGKVVELGGGTGILSYFAAKKASKVWCVERNRSMVQAAKRFLQLNAGGQRVQVVHADALDYLPPEPVDVLICEMLHVALICEKQLEVLRSFSERYLAKFGPPLPKFLPDACVLSVQPIEQNFVFSGYEAPVPLFAPAGSLQPQQLLAAPKAYSTICYDTEIPTRFGWTGAFTIERSGRLNAVSFLTKNFLAFVLQEQRAIEWPMNLMILPLPQSQEVVEGDVVRIGLAYRAGGSVGAMQDSLAVDYRSANQASIRQAA